MEKRTKGTKRIIISRSRDNEKILGNVKERKREEKKINERQVRGREREQGRDKDRTRGGEKERKKNKKKEM